VLRLLDECGAISVSRSSSSARPELTAGIADRIAVLYRGRLVEQGPTAEVLSRPLHRTPPLLTASAPRIDGARPLAPAAGVSVPFRCPHRPCGPPNPAPACSPTGARWQPPMPYPAAPSAYAGDRQRACTTRSPPNEPSARTARAATAH